MKAWGSVDTLTFLFLLLVIICCTKCDKGVGKSVEKGDSQDHETGDHGNGHDLTGTSSAKANLTLGASNATVNASKPELHASSREGVPTKQSTLSLPKVESSSGKPPAPQPMAKEPLKVLSSSEATKKQNQTGGSLHEDVAKTWMEGGGSLPGPKPKQSAPSEHKKLSSQSPGEEVKYPNREHHKNIAARKGAGVPPDAPSEPHPAHAEHVHPHPTPSAVATSPPTTRPRKYKPHFTMVQGDKFTSGSESILESPTTGRDYVFPLVLLIFAVPGTVFLIRFLYKRGTEFTERQQYHRMYLIDGMYNAR